MNRNKENSCNTVFPRDIVCLRNMSINTLHKGDDDDDDNNNSIVEIKIHVTNVHCRKLGVNWHIAEILYYV